MRRLRETTLGIDDGDIGSAIKQAIVLMKMKDEALAKGHEVIYAITIKCGDGFGCVDVTTAKRFDIEARIKEDK
jgi:hypothetical protein